MLMQLLVVLLCVVAASVGIYCVVTMITWVVYVPRIKQMFTKTPWHNPASYTPIEGGEKQVVTTHDGLSLRGTYLRATGDRCLGVVAFCHGLGGDRWGVVPYAKELLERGFDVFAFDFRNHGESDSQPGYRPMPWLTEDELKDTQSVIKHLASRCDADTKGIALIGVSKGANAALCAAARNRSIRAIVTDSAFSTGPLQRHYIRRFMNIYLRLPYVAEYLPEWCLISHCKWAHFLFRLRNGCRIVDIDQSVRSVVQPVFMIHGKKDAYVPSSIAERLRHQLPGRSKLWFIKGASHNGAVITVTDNYLQRIAKFLVWSFRDSKVHRRRRNGYSRVVSRLLGRRTRRGSAELASTVPPRT